MAKDPSTEVCLRSPYNFMWEFPNVGNLTKFIIEKALDYTSQGFGDKRWITNTENGDFVTLSQVEPLSRRIALHFRARGMKSGDIFLYNSHNPTHLYLIFLGVWRAGGCLRSIYPQETAQTITQIIVESKAKWFLIDPENLKTATSACKKVPWPVEIFVPGRAKDKLTGVTCTDKLIKVEADDKYFEIGGDMAIVLPTSGTTGYCKGCVYTQFQGAKTLIAYKQRLFTHNNEGPPFKLLTLARPTHIGGFFSAFASLVANKEIFMVPNVTKENLYWAIHQHCPDAVAGFPSRLSHLLEDAVGGAGKKFDLSCLNFIFSSGASLPKSFVEAIKAKFNAPVINIYGMTECSGSFVSNKNFDPMTQHESIILADAPPLSSGKLMPGTLLQVRDTETGEILGENQCGQLCFKSPLQCSGYYKLQAEEHTFLKGWILSGDIGYYDENKFIFVVNRLKECFKYFNNHISPNELEEIILEHPAVEKVCVVGIPDPVDKANAIPRAFVSLTEGSKVSAQEIANFANEQLASYKQLKGGLYILANMPVGKTGKMDTNYLKQLQVSSLK